MVGSAVAAAALGACRRRRHHRRGDRQDVGRVPRPSRRLHARRPVAVDVLVVNKADYIYKIKTEQNGINGHAWTKLLRTPARERAKKLGEELAEDLAKLAKGE